MAKVCCSCCLLDAIFTCSDDQFKACPKHYFSDIAQGHKLERIKMPINTESKEILLLHLIKLKWIFKEYKKKWKWLDEAFHYCNRIIIFLQRKKFVHMKLILSPFEYFLTQPKEKAQQYIKQNWNRVDLLELCRAVKAHVFDFNYFGLEDQKYIHGWAYKSSYNLNRRLSKIYVEIFLDFIKTSEYEMAYELYQNLISYLEFYDRSSIGKLKKIFKLFGNILKKIIKKENYSQLHEKWNKNINGLLPKFLKKLNRSALIEKSTRRHSSKILVYWAYYWLGRVLDMMSIDNNISVYYCKILCDVEYLSKFGSKSFANKINQELGLLYYNNKNYEKSVIYSMKSINFYKKRLLDESAWQYKVGIWNDSLEYLIGDYRCLAKAYRALKNYEAIKQILSEVEFECSLTKDKFLYLATIGEIHYLLNDFDKAYEIIFKCIKKSKQNNLMHAYELSNLWLYIAEIHTWKGNFTKAHESLCVAKSFLSNLPIADQNEQEIYKAFGVFYLNRQWYEDALKNFKLMKNKWSNHEVLFTKLSMGIVYFWMLRIFRAKKFLIEAKNLMSEFTESYKNELFIANAYIGELYNLRGKLEKAEKYFNVAFKFINYYDIFKIDMFLVSQSFVFSYFYWKSDYTKCKVVILRINQILKNNNHLKFRKPYYFIQKAELHIALNKIQKAEKCLRKAEKLLDINNILLYSQKSIKINDLDLISDYIELAKIYINLFNISDEYRQKAKSILKYAEKVVNTNRLNDRFSKLAIYYCLGALYFKEQKWEKSRRCNQISLDLYKQFKHNSKAVRNPKPRAVSMEKYLKFMNRKYQMHIQS